MRTDLRVGEDQVLAVVLAEVATLLTFPMNRIKLAVERGKFGHKRITKDFLIPGMDSEHVKRDVNSRRRRCEALILSKLDSSDQIKAGKCRW